MTRIDLHTHTLCSDGSDSPETLIAKAAEAGLSAVAITDHDTFDALVPAAQAAKAHGIELLPGCEVSTALPSGVVHILAYGMDTGHAGLLSLLDRIRSARTRRNVRILEKLASLGAPVSETAIHKQADGPIVARPHIAQALVEAGHVESVREAFDRFLNDRGPAYEQARLPDPIEAIRCIVAAGGAAVVAHPRQMRLGSVGRYRRVFTKWRGAGLAGIEVQHVSHDTTHRNRYALLAKELDLVPTGGSDYHGAAKPWLRLGVGDGTIEVRRGTWDALCARMAP